MILCENYVKVVAVEAKLTAFIARTMILPAALRYQEQVAQSIQALAAAGVQVPGRQKELLNALTNTVDSFQAATDKLDRALGHKAEGDLLAHAKYVREFVIPTCETTCGASAAGMWNTGPLTRQVAPPLTVVAGYVSPALVVASANPNVLLAKTRVPRSDEGTIDPT